MNLTAIDQQFRSDPARTAWMSTGGERKQEHQAAGAPCGTVSRLRLQRMRELSRPRTGFTLVELMIAVAILAVLAAIAVPTYQSYYERARVAQAKSDIRSLENMINRYFSDKRQYPDTLADIGKAGTLDPWKRPYQYLKLFPADKKLTGQSRKDKNLVPINSDYDLYSMGRDGASQGPLTAKASRDDIVRANDGRFLGLASDH